MSAEAQCSISASTSYLPSPNVCTGQTLTLSASSNVTGVSYLWSGPNSFSDTNQNATIPNVTAANAGTYRVIVSKVSCVSDTDSVVIVINTTPTPPLVPQTPICSGDTLKINMLQFPKNTTAIGWAPDGKSDTTIKSPLVFPNALKHTHSGEYKVIVSNSICTSDTLRVIIPQHNIVYRPDTPVASIAKNPLCSGDTLQLSATSSTTVQGYYWTGPNQQNYITQNINISGYSIVGQQQFVVRTDSNGCFSVPDTINIDVHPIKTPSVTISADPSFIVSQNVQVTLTAKPLDTGVNLQFQWRKNGVEILGATKRTLSVVTSQDVQPGDLITVWIKTTPSCAPVDTALSNPVSINITASIDDIDKSVLMLFPNPANNFLTVSAPEQIDLVEVYTITGKRINVESKHNQSNSVYINTSNLSSGMYLLKTNLGMQRFLKTK